MSYTNNIYIPYIKGFHNEDKFIIYKNYYTSLGFNVKTFGDDSCNDINYSDLINNLILTEQEEIFVIVDYVIIPSFSLHQAIDLCNEYECLVKPMNKTYIIDNDYETILDKLINNDVLDNFNYSNKMSSTLWPLDGSWVIKRNNFNNFVSINNNIKGPIAFDFDLCYKYLIDNKIIFIETDSYKISPSPVNIKHEVKMIYSRYIESMMNFFDFPENLYVYKNQHLIKFNECDIKEKIFNLNKYFLSQRYI